MLASDTTRSPGLLPRGQATWQARSRRKGNPARHYRPARALSAKVPGGNENLPGLAAPLRGVLGQPAATRSGRSPAASAPPAVAGAAGAVRPTSTRPGDPASGRGTSLPSTPRPSQAGRSRPRRRKARPRGAARRSRRFPEPALPQGASPKPVAAAAGSSGASGPPRPSLPRAAPPPKASSRKCRLPARPRAANSGTLPARTPWAGNQAALEPAVASEVPPGHLPRLR